MAVTYSFENLQVWQQAHSFVLLVYKVTRHFPSDEKYGLTSQFRRAAISIEANIAEGYKKIGKSDKLRFLILRKAVWRNVEIITFCQKI